MGKLSLNSVKEYLSREEMRNVFGGDDRLKKLDMGEGCFSPCGANSDCRKGDCRNCIYPFGGGKVGECGS